MGGQRNHGDQPVNRATTVICILAGFSFIDGSLIAQNLESAAPRSTEPAVIKALIDRAEQGLDSKKSDVSAFLSDPEFLSAHAWPRFRQIIRRHAPTAKVMMVTAQEPGDRLRVRLRLVEADGAAGAGALVYLSHTDARGDYGPNDANVPLAGSDNEYARLFCYVVTDSDGAVEIQTIRPGGYPDTGIPAHIHLRITTRGGRSVGAEIWFDDDPRITRQARHEAAQEGVVICPVTVDAHGQRWIDALIRLD
jgi:hypothetical protein